MKFDRKAAFRRLVTVRVRRDQKTWRPNWIRDAVTLTRIFVNSIRGKQSNSRKEQRGCINEKEIISHVMQAATLRMLDVVKEVIDISVAINPVVVVTGVN